MTDYSNKELRMLTIMQRRMEWCKARYKYSKMPFDGEEAATLKWALGQLALARGPWEEAVAAYNVKRGREPSGAVAKGEKEA